MVDKPGGIYGYRSTFVVKLKVSAARIPGTPISIRYLSTKCGGCPPNLKFRPPPRLKFALPTRPR